MKNEIAEDIEYAQEIKRQKQDQENSKEEMSVGAWKGVIEKS